MPVSYGKGDKKKATELASKIIRTSVGHCEKCGEPEFSKLTCSHIIGRKYSNTRTDLDNLQCLCFKCHRRLTDFPREFSHWITESIGSDEYERLRLKAELGSTKFDWTEELSRLKQLAKDMGI